ncbi:hypothetical protein DPMN_172666 [Dreissena polymorpha]|uniref:Uncharacterized protein n=1 Tax=Dreissena polymorpha TaxID=45954 RepID=A0A9D4IDI5_DREPO|nr:hypothetical protein DPMN_172666 [Dreissena polymorpha]
MPLEMISCNTDENPQHDCNEALSNLAESVGHTQADGADKTSLHFNVISKVSIGKAIIKLCGNEGTSDDSGLRRLLQAVIDYIPTEKDQSVWTNAEVEIYDVNFKRYTITSGNGDRKFYASYDERNSPIVVRESRHISWFKSVKNFFSFKSNSK